MTEHSYRRYRRISDTWNIRGKGDRLWPTITAIQACAIALLSAEVNGEPTEKIQADYEAIKTHIVKASNGV